METLKFPKKNAIDHMIFGVFYHINITCKCSIASTLPVRSRFYSFAITITAMMIITALLRYS